jgi:hypothetical protein
MRQMSSKNQVKPTPDLATRYVEVKSSCFAEYSGLIMIELRSESNELEVDQGKRWATCMRV